MVTKVHKVQRHDDNGGADVILRVSSISEANDLVKRYGTTDSFGIKVVRSPLRDGQARVRVLRMGATSLACVIPKPMAEALGLKRGAICSIRLSNGGAVIRLAESAGDEHRPESHIPLEAV